LQLGVREGIDALLLFIAVIFSTALVIGGAPLLRKCSDFHSLLGLNFHVFRGIVATLLSINYA
jgi:hypothetical protein